MDTMTRYSPTDIAMRMHRRHAIVTTDGIEGVSRVTALLRASDYRVRGFTADVREGIAFSTLTCTVSLTPAEADTFVNHLLLEPSVVSVDRC